jgi:hypothetical protein
MIRLIPALCVLLPVTATAGPRTEDAGMGGASAATAAIGAVLGQAVMVWEAVEARDPRLARSCVELTAKRQARTMSFDFSGCESYGMTGTVELEIVGPKRVVVTFGEDFSSHGHGLMGTFSAEVESRQALVVTTTDAKGGPTELVVSDLTDDHVTVLDQLDLRMKPTKGSVQMYGTSHMLHVGGEVALEGALDVGAAGAEPLTWYMPVTQTAPQDGVMSLATEVTATFKVGVDPMGTGSSVVVPVETQVAGTFWVEFAETCEESSVSFTTDQDVVVNVGLQVGDQSVIWEVTVPAEDVEQSINASLALGMECPAA